MQKYSRWNFFSGLETKWWGKYHRLDFTMSGCYSMHKSRSGENSWHWLQILDLTVPAGGKCLTGESRASLDIRFLQRALQPHFLKQYTIICTSVVSVLAKVGFEFSVAMMEMGDKRNIFCFLLLFSILWCWSLGPYALGIKRGHNEEIGPCSLQTPQKLDVTKEEWVYFHSYMIVPKTRWAKCLEDLKNSSERHWNEATPKY